MLHHRSGYTLPVFACASAIAALRHLHQEIVGDTVDINLIEPPQTVSIPIEQVAKITANTAIAITRSDPGDNLDLTRNTPIWAMVELFVGDGAYKVCRPTADTAPPQGIRPQVIIKGGEGIGIQFNNEGKAAIYSYANRLLPENLQPLLQFNEQAIVTIILPEGRRLAERTSNSAFGVVEGLSLLGTTGISQPLSSPNQLEIYQKEIAAKAKEFDCLVFCVGENGLDLAQKIGINPAQLLKTANWLGPMLVNAALQGVQNILLFGYHGKLIKLAGGIFHTHHHLADGRLEILTAHCAKVGLRTAILEQVLNASTTDEALNLLRGLDKQEGSNWVEQVYTSISTTIDHRSQDYIRKHAEKFVQVGSILFDRDRSIVIQSQKGMNLWQKCAELVQ